MRIPWIYILSIFVFLIIAIPLTIAFFPWWFSQEQAVYQQQCMDREWNFNNTGVNNITYRPLTMNCMIGTQYPERLPDVQTNITIKSVREQWLGDCKVLTTDGEMLWSNDEVVCMSQPGDALTVYKHRMRDNTITNEIRL